MAISREVMDDLSSDATTPASTATVDYDKGIWDGWKWLAGIGGGILGAIVGGGIPGAIAGFSAGYGLLGGIDSALTAQEDAATVKTLLDKQGELLTAQEEDRAKLEALAAQERSALELQANIAEKNNIRQAQLASQEMEQNVKGANEQSRAAAIARTQAESEGTAALAGSGISEGSPYTALDASIAESRRQTQQWWEGAKLGVGINAETRAMEFKGNQVQVSLLRNAEKKAVAQVEYYKEDGLYDLGLQNDRLKLERGYAEVAYESSPWTLADRIAGSVVSSAVSAYGLGTSAYAGLKMLGAESGGFALDGFFANGSMFKKGGEIKFAQMTGDYSAFMGKPNPLSLITGVQ